MRKTLTIFTTAIAAFFSFTAYAQDPMDHKQHMQHMAAAGSDTRQQVNFPPEMRQHTLTNMRDHLEALSGILSSMSAGKFAKAAQVASERLGMDSPSAEGCKSEETSGKPQMSKPMNMDHQMSQFMPEGMRNIGLAMHQAASDFAVEANKAGKSGNPKLALAALSKVAQQCVACHASYKVQ
ncbi:MAG: hypothetical protein EKK46_17765 [Rhodocyclaceae bacterium]|nr:MAG: hypothetical protein EKK46_17765 [Rhodocyclaceae bacterium]